MSRWFTKTHEWVLVEDGEAKIGITDYAQKELGDVVYVELPEVGKILTQGETFGSIESVKAVSDLYAPISGEVVGVNGVLEEKPELVNEDPYGEGWMIAVTITDRKELDQLMEEEAYQAYLQESSS